MHKRSCSINHPFVPESIKTVSNTRELWISVMTAFLSVSLRIVARQERGVVELDVEMGHANENVRGHFNKYDLPSVFRNSRI